MVSNSLGYARILFWLPVVSALCLVLERLWPWRREQRLLRRGFAQDLFWLFFNGHCASILIASVAVFLLGWAWPAMAGAKSLRLLADQPLWVQFAAFFLLKDFLEWGIRAGWSTRPECCLWRPAEGCDAARRSPLAGFRSGDAPRCSGGTPRTALGSSAPPGASPSFRHSS